MEKTFRSKILVATLFITVAIGLTIWPWIAHWISGNAEQAIRTDVYEESRSHVRGVNQDIAKYRLDITLEDISEDQAEQLERLALMKARRINDRNLDESNKQWIQELREERGLQ